MPQAWESKKTSDLPKIAVCIPYISKWEPEWVEFTYSRLRFTPTAWCDKMLFMCKVPSLPVARDILVKQSLDNKCDYTFFVDTDHIFETPSDPNLALNHLYQCMNKSKDSKDSKIISGLYRAKQRVGFNNAMWMRQDNRGYTPVIKWTGNWIRVDVCGLGCCLIDNMVFKEIPRPWFKWDMAEDISEDFYFCELANKHGYNTHVLTDVKLSHLGDLKVQADGTITTPGL